MSETPVTLVVDGRTVTAPPGRSIVAAAWAAGHTLVEACIMCNLCTAAGPEQITPNHVGLFARRLTAALVSRPANLLRRLEQLERGELGVVIDRPHPEEGAHG